MLALRYTFLLAVVIAAGSVRAEEAPRTWTDTSGRKVDATFVRVFNGKAILESKDGRSIPVPLARLSAADQQYIRDLTSSKRPAGDVDSKSNQPSTAAASDNAASPSSDVKRSEGPRSENLKAKMAAAELRRTRDWSHNGGNTFKGKFERFFGQQAVIMQGNRARKIDFSDLSAADQEFLRGNFEAQGKGAEVPNVIARANTSEGNNSAAQNALGASLGQLAGALANGAGASSTGPGAIPPGNPQGGFPNFGAVGEQMRQQQERMRQEQEQRRAELDEIKRKTRETVAKLEAARRIPTSPRVQSPPVNVASASPSGYGAGSSSPAMPATTPPISQPSGFSGGGAAASGNIPQSPFSQPAAAEQPNAEPASPFGNLPNLFAGSPAAQPQLQQVEVIQCGKCGKQQRPGFKAGQKCQHCGTTIDIITDESGKVVDKSVRAKGKSIKFWVWVVIVAISVIGGVITKLKGS